MNIYIVVEGVIGEVKVYRNWVPLVNPRLSFVTHISKIVTDNFAIISGNGYPQYYDIINSAIEDVNIYGNIDRLVISIDSEEMSFQEKYNEIEQHVSGLSCTVPIHIVVQHFCLETWALGNQAIIRPHPQCPDLRKYLNLYNVRVDDPELLPDYAEGQLNRAQFAEKYLRRALNDKYRNLSYSKNNPQALLHPKYFQRVKGRFEETGHIDSFRHFLTAFL